MKSLWLSFGSFTTFVLLAACSTVAPMRVDATAPVQFERLKSLAGEWVALAEDSDAPAGTLVRYRVTSGGSALVETLFADTPHEMVTVYTLDRGQLALTHYCTMANQPRMIAEPSTAPDTIRFSLAGGANIDVEKGSHMGAAEFHFVNEARVHSKWTMIKDGKPGESVRFSLARSWR